MTVVADTSPINYLVLIGQIGVLRVLYGRVVVPPAVLTELRHKMAPESVREWAIHLPEWVAVVDTKDSAPIPGLGAGESDAICVAGEIAADVILIDEQAGRREAVRRGLRVAGTLAVIDEAAQGGLLSFDDAVERLTETSFRVSPDVLAAIRRRRLK